MGTFMTGLRNGSSTCTITDFEIGYIFADSGYNTNNFVTYDNCLDYRKKAIGVSASSEVSAQQWNSFFLPG
jgi:hypothetical protein